MALKKNLIIISAGALGREVRDLAAGIETAEGEECPWRLKGFLDDRDLLPSGIPILGSPATYKPHKDDVFICAIGEPSKRAEYSTMLRDKGAQFTTLVDPSSKVGGRTRLCAGSLIGPFCVISCNVEVGEDTILTAHVTVGHDVRIGACCHLGAYAFLGGGSTVADKVTIHPHVSISPGVLVGDSATIGSGSVVIRSVDKGATVFGVPALPVAS
jgi:sugar O-acyltransferase (sialic acid O-acetyltransferase NeuD family)